MCQQADDHADLYELGEQVYNTCIIDTNLIFTP